MAPYAPSMAYHITDREGITELNPPAGRLRALLDSLEDDGPDHADFWLTHESGWTLTVFPSGWLELDHADRADPPVHLEAVSRPRTLELLLALARGEIETVRAEKWTSRPSTRS